jgi:hypothetical protein
VSHSLSSIYDFSITKGARIATGKLLCTMRAFLCVLYRLQYYSGHQLPTHAGGKRHKNELGVQSEKKVIPDEQIDMKDPYISRMFFINASTLFVLLHTRRGWSVVTRALTAFRRVQLVFVSNLHVKPGVF